MNTQPTFSVTGISRRRLLKAALAATACSAFSLSPFKRIRAQSAGRYGLALCIGLNEVNPNAYSGWRGKLSGCIQDSRDMQGIAEEQDFYDVKRLNDAQATIDKVRSHIAWAANDLRSGDLFMISCSSHGSYRRDANGDEVDQKDETWCLWDGQWSDDDRYALWTRFAPGVRILIVGDMCHSGTTARVLQSLDEMQRAPQLEQESRDLEKMARSIPGSRDLPSPAAADTIPELTNEMLGVSQDRLRAYGKVLEKGSQTRDIPQEGDLKFGEQFNQGDEPSPIRAMPDALAEYLSSVEAEKFAAPGERSSASAVRAKCLLLSACQDTQTALDGQSNGVFTNTLKRAWENGAFQGTYDKFYETLLHMLRNYPSHQPGRDVFGEGRFTEERPFSI